jgi:LPXTG-site transpeptidase (sortase) family protein
MDRKKVRIILLSLAGALAVAAAVVFAVLWNEGVSAGNNAQAVLDASGITPGTSGASAADAETPGGSPAGSPLPTLTPELQGYTVVARIDIDKIGAHLPVLSKATKAALKVSVCYYEGAMPGEDGNMVITGHNYASGAHFGKLEQVAAGDTVLLTSRDGTTQTYTVYEIDHIRPDEPEALNDTEYARELTLLTCETQGNGRLVVRCHAET